MTAQKIRANSVLPARREPVTLTTADGLSLVAELARPADREPVATLVCLLELTMMRIGNEEYARTNHSYGFTFVVSNNYTTIFNIYYFILVVKNPIFKLPSHTIKIGNSSFYTFFK